MEVFLVKQTNAYNYMKKNILLFFAVAFITSAIAQAPTDGLVSYYPFNGNAKDEVGGNDGEVLGANLTMDRNQKSKSAYYFDGVDDYIMISDNNFPEGASEYSFSAWVYLEDVITNNWHSILSYGINTHTNTDNGKSNSFWINNRSDTSWIVSNENRNRANRSKLDSNHFGKEEWHLLTFTKGTNHELGKWYIDGVELPVEDQILTNTTRNITLTGYGLIGRNYLYTTPPLPQYSYFWKGALDEIRIYDRILTSQEIANMYDSEEMTCHKVIYDTVLVSVTDTLVIDVTVTGITNDQETEKLKIYPNPASSHINIIYSDFTALNGYRVIIMNSASQEVYNDLIDSSNDSIDISTLGSTGLYFIQIYDSKNELIETKKLVLE